jgi:hypothetical protein
MRATRYWRATSVASGRLEDDRNSSEASRFNDNGYALVVVDARGSGASFGVRPYELTQEEVRDYGEIADWVVEQPWSNGRVGAWGVSCSGNTAEMLAVNGHRGWAARHRSPRIRRAGPVHEVWPPPHGKTRRCLAPGIGRGCRADVRSLGDVRPGEEGTSDPCGDRRRRRRHVPALPERGRQSDDRGAAESLPRIAHRAARPGALACRDSELSCTSCPRRQLESSRHVFIL